MISEGRVLGLDARDWYLLFAGLLLAGLLTWLG
jgi:hypothetical protein